MAVNSFQASVVQDVDQPVKSLADALVDKRLAE